MSQLVTKLGGRKFALILYVCTILTLFGGYAIHMKVPLGEASLFVGAVGATVYGYMRENVKQKANGGA